MLTRLKIWWRVTRLKWAVRIAHANGLTVVKLQTRAGVDYITLPNGQMMRIGRK